MKVKPIQILLDQLKVLYLLPSDLKIRDNILYIIMLSGIKSVFMKCHISDCE